jgi:hypothetical protein
MNMKHILIYLLLCTTILSAQNPLLLQPWVEVYGDTNGTSLGLQVMGFIPKPYFPYKAGVTQARKTGLYKLQSQSDKNPYGFTIGDNIKAADLNGDGYADMIFRKSGESLFPDTVEIFWGTVNGIDSINTTKIIGEDRKDGFGLSICTGNIIGDSITDLVVAATYFPQGFHQGKIYIYEGSNQFSAMPTKTILGDSISFNYGLNCAIGDVNNDGNNDLVIRGYNSNTQPTRYGYLDIYLGSASFDTVRDSRITGKDNSLRGLACFDVNGDGINDVLWSNRESATVDRVYVHFGGSSFSTTPNMKLQNPGVANFGNEITNAEDMNGDSYNDIAVGAYRGSITSGYVFIFGGGPKINDFHDASYSKSTDGGFGTSISSVGDVNGDGLDDIIVGAPDYPFGENKGYWGIFLGSTNIKVTSVKNEQPQQPQLFELFQNYPNPFNGTTVISYQLEKEATVTLKITNTLGQEVKRFNEGEKIIGKHHLTFNAKDLASGWYLYTIAISLKNTQQIFTQSKAMILEK